MFIASSPHRPPVQPAGCHILALLLASTSLVFGCASSRRAGLHDAPENIQELTAEINRVLADSAFVNANWAVLITNMDTQEILYQRNANKSFLPASNAKIFTTAAGLDQLGPDYVYTTRAYLKGDIENGILQGDIIIRGAGDPVIGGRFNDGDVMELFREWADSLASLGITRIRGDIIGDDNFFDDQPLGMAWSWDDEPFWYSAEISALSLNDNSIDFTITGRQQGEPARIVWSPAQTTYASMTNHTQTVHADSSRSLHYGRRRGTNRFEIDGVIPEGKTYQISLSVFNPTLFFVHVLRETLIQSGLYVEGQPVDMDSRSDSVDYSAAGVLQFATHTSRPLEDIVYVLNKRSHNLYAEMLLKTLGSANPVPNKNGGSGNDLDPGSAAMGIARAMDTFAAAGADTSRMHLRDGSGLSRMNYITAEMTSSVLSYMWSHPDERTRSAFLESLPIGGLDGTLEFRFRTGPATGVVRAKTGTLTGVSSLSGYVPSHGGSPISFVLMCNQYTVPASSVRRAQDAIVELLATYRK